MTLQCARCHRKVREPIVVAGLGYGKTCAALVGDLLTQPVKRGAGPGRRRARARDDRQQPLITEVLP